MRSESVAGAAAMSGRHRSEHRRAQHKQHEVLIFRPHTARKSSSTSLGAVSLEPEEASDTVATFPHGHPRTCRSILI
ncbi:hypothetical protein F2P81_002521 [Scophthalmus maximus]|uniref:Uncharacterized protein n=1 Tax=Scophthalmus maximus TaxID=52904 RepID=A0A6A4TVD9_SCOMX|nr:hypothetical protein F2P81_002521 [Scophthalmus maximus]